jgi:hypothetical protein
MGAYSINPRPRGEAPCPRLGPLARHHTDTKSCLAVGLPGCRLWRATRQMHLLAIPKALRQWALLEADALKTTPPRVNSGTVRSRSPGQVFCDHHQRPC